MESETGLVLQNPRDRLATKIANWRKENITAQEQQALDHNKARYFELFKYFSGAWEGLSKKLILELDRDELVALEECLYERAIKKHKRFLYFLQPFLLGVPVIGWIVLVARYGGGNYDFPAYKFLSSRRNLEKLLGKNFFPALADEFVNYLKAS